MKQKEILEKLEGELKDSGDQIRLIKKFFSYMAGKNIRKLGGKMKFYYLKIILFLFFINIAHCNVSPFRTAMCFIQSNGIHPGSQCFTVQDVARGVSRCFEYSTLLNVLSSAHTKATGYTPVRSTRMLVEDLRNRFTPQDAE